MIADHIAKVVEVTIVAYSSSQSSAKDTFFSFLELNKCTLALEFLCSVIAQVKPPTEI